MAHGPFKKVVHFCGHKSDSYPTILGNEAYVNIGSRTKRRKQKAPVVDVKKAQADISTLLKPDIIILQRHIS
jgi:hypothetical protein